MARVLGMTSEAEYWEKRATSLLNLMLEKLWDAETGLFWARRGENIVPVRTPFSLFPLLTGRLPGEVARRLVEHLNDPQEFWARYPVPTVALNEPAFSPLLMWRGPTWINVNYLLIEGLVRSGFRQEAVELRTRTMELLMGQNDIYEYYSPETGEGSPRAAGTFGWSAALFIDLALQATIDLDDD
jgi:glycogen debranching enzyme